MSDPAAEQSQTHLDPVLKAAAQARRDAAAAEASGFHLVAELGRGAMGVVYEATQLRLGRRVALKVMRPELSVDTSYFERFQREARALAKLNHPHIVQVYDQGTVGTSLYLALEFVDGEDVARRIQRMGKLPAQEALRIATDIARGLQHAQDEGVIHRDVKPANLLVCESRSGTLVAKITDFGLARTPDQSELTHAGTLLGTPAYMAPELTQGERADSQSDLYGLGAALYHMLTGQLPFRATTVVNVLLNKQTPCLNNPQDYAPDLADDVVWVLDRMLAREPDERYASYDELIADLERLLAGETVTVTPVPDDATSFATRPGRSLGGSPAARSRTALLSVAAGVLLIVGAGAFFQLSGDRGAQTADAAPPPAAPATADVEPAAEQSGHRLQLRTAPPTAELTLRDMTRPAPYIGRVPTGEVAVRATAPGHHPLETTVHVTGDLEQTLFLAPLGAPLKDSPAFNLEKLEPAARRRLRLLNLSDPNLVLAWNQVGSWSVRRSREDLAAGTGGFVGEGTARGPSVATREDFPEVCQLLTSRGAAGWRLRWTLEGERSALRPLTSPVGTLVVGVDGGRAFVGVERDQREIQREVAIKAGAEVSFQLDWDGAVATVSISTEGRPPKLLHAVALAEAEPTLQLVTEAGQGRFADFSLVALVN